MRLTNDLILDCDDGRDEKLFLDYHQTSFVKNTRCEDTNSSPCHVGYYDVCYQRHDICTYKESDTGLLAPCRNAAHLKACRSHQCPTKYKCIESYCVEHDKVCDGISHCPMGEDESDCGNRITNNSCPGLYKCKDSYVCIHSEQICDQKVNCPIRGEDEKRCDILPCPNNCTCIGNNIDCSHQRLFRLPKSSSTIHTLIVSHNMITTLNNLECGYMLQLKLDYNLLQKLQPEYFHTCLKLLYLDISYNVFNAFSKGDFVKQGNLIYLDISHNPIWSLHESYFQGLTSLRSLIFSSTKLRYLGNCVFSKMTSLHTLEIYKTSLIDLDDNSFCNLARLQSLILINNTIAYITGNPFQALPYMTVIETDAHHVCCSASKYVPCHLVHGSSTFSGCSYSIIPHRFIGFMRASAIIIITCNVVSIIFWIRDNSDKKGLILIMAMNIFDIVMGLYFLVLAVADKYYDIKYTSWSLEYWNLNWICTIALSCVQLSFQLSLYIAALHSFNRLFLTRYAMTYRRYSISLLFMNLFLEGGVVVSVSLTAATVATSNISSPLCIFYSSSNAYFPSRWIMLAYNCILITIVIICDSLVVDFFLFRKNVRSDKNQKQKLKEKLLIIRLIVACIVHIFILIMMTLTQIVASWETSSVSVIVTTTQLCVYSIRAVLNPLINTFSTTKFLTFIRQLY